MTCEQCEENEAVEIYRCSICSAAICSAECLAKHQGSFLLNEKSK